jgi:hypothetical protein
VSCVCRWFEALRCCDVSHVWFAMWDGIRVISDLFSRFSESKLRRGPREAVFVSLAFIINGSETAVSRLSPLCAIAAGILNFSFLGV